MAVPAEVFILSLLVGSWGVYEPLKAPQAAQQWQLVYLITTVCFRDKRKVNRKWLWWADEDFCVTAESASKEVIFAKWWSNFGARNWLRTEKIFILFEQLWRKCDSQLLMKPMPVPCKAIRTTLSHYSHKQHCTVFEFSVAVKRRLVLSCEEYENNK